MSFILRLSQVINRNQYFDRDQNRDQNQDRTETQIKLNQDQSCLNFSNLSKCSELIVSCLTNKESKLEKN